MTPGAASSQGSLALDGRSLDALKSQASRDPRAAVREAARQFEALFMNELLKSLRATTGGTGMLDNEGSRMSTEMLDGQWAQVLAGRPGGLAQAIERQLDRHVGGDRVARQAAAVAESPAAAPGPRPPASSVPGTAPSAALRFVERHAALAEQAQSRTGVPAAFMVAQAALETGWGQRQILQADGTPTHNLFGIKATAEWKGRVAEVVTTEYVGGQPRKVVERFRAYASVEESFADYARLLGSARYRAVAAGSGDASAFARGLQQAGYATDPAYAEKLSRVINTTLRLQRSVA